MSCPSGVHFCPHLSSEPHEGDINGVKLVIRKKQVGRRKVNRIKSGNWKCIIQQQHRKEKCKDKNKHLRPF